MLDVFAELDELDLEDSDMDDLMRLVDNAYNGRAGEKAVRNTKPKKALRILSGILFWTVLIVLIGGVVLFAASRDSTSSFLGLRVFGVLSDSMTPRADGSSPPGGFRKNDMIVVRTCAPGDVKVKDIITFRASAQGEEPVFLTHRVAEIRTELNGAQGLWFVTRGDANNADDPPVSGEALIGKKILTLPRLGGFLQKVRENIFLAILTIACCVACTCAFRWYFAAAGKQAKERQSDTDPPGQKRRLV